MGLGPCSGDCLARVIGRVIGARGGSDGLNDYAAGLGRWYVLELRSHPLADFGAPARLGSVNPSALLAQCSQADGGLAAILH